MAVNKLVSLPQKMFKVEKVNCICVDWEHGAWTEYTQAVHNTRVVGAEIAFFVQGLSVNPCPGHMLWEGAGRGPGQHPRAPRGSLGTHGVRQSLEARSQGRPLLQEAANFPPWLS